MVFPTPLLVPTNTPSPERLLAVIEIAPLVVLSVVGVKPLPTVTPATPDTVIVLTAVELELKSCTCPVADVALMEDVVTAEVELLEPSFTIALAPVDLIARELPAAIVVAVSDPAGAPMLMFVAPVTLMDLPALRLLRF
jgi:hypothetical protein